MNKKFFQETLILFLLLTAISICIGFVRYKISKPFIFIGSINKNSFVKKPINPKVVSVEEIYKWVQIDSAILIDTRGEEDYNISTIQNAVLWQDEKIKDIIALCRQNKNKKIVFFCAKDCEHAFEVSQRLSKIVPQEFFIMFDGFETWEDFGYPVDFKLN